jgi:hypothetical protein
MSEPSKDQDESDKLSYAMGGMDLEESQAQPVDASEFVKHLRGLGFNPQVQSQSEVNALMSILHGGPSVVKSESSLRASSSPQSPFDVNSINDQRRYKQQYPKFSIFYGETSKGEVNWDTFRFEVESVLFDNIFEESQILLGIRRSLKGSAADKLRHLGTGASLQHVLDKLESAYGTIETTESIMRNFYTCSQKDNESIEQYASRLEDIFNKAVLLQAVSRTNTDLLKQVLRSGIKKELRHISWYQSEKLTYEDFKFELRRLEAELQVDCKPCKPIVHDKPAVESSEVLDLLKKINARIDTLEESHKQAAASNQHYKQQWGNSQPNVRGGGRGQRGRGGNAPRPLGSTTFAPFVCGIKGHRQLECPTILSQLTCSLCKEKGHLRHSCPQSQQESPNM